MTEERTVPGRFIVLEGIDGAGTTTQIERLAAWLRQRGHLAHVTREPSQGPIGATIRHILQGRLMASDGMPVDGDIVALLFAADRLDHVDSEIAPLIDEGAFVLSDRYVLSSLAYQGEECPPKWVQEINRRARKPDLTLFLRVRVETALARIEQRRATRERFEHEGFLRLVAERYERLLALAPTEETVIIDGEASLEAVENEIRGAVDRWLPTRSSPTT